MSWQLYNSSRLQQKQQQSKKKGRQHEPIISSLSRSSSLSVTSSSKHQQRTLVLSKALVLAAASVSLAMVLAVYKTSDDLSVRFGMTDGGSNNIICSTTNYIVTNTPTTDTTAAVDTARTTTVTSFLKESFGEKEVTETISTTDSSSSSSTNETTTTTKPTPKVAWLMSFPNSGTSFTIHNIRSVSRKTTASNYATEGAYQNEVSIPIHDGASFQSGPFLELIPNINTTIPNKYILTKTHCAGYCSDCIPENYIETPRSFQMLCQSGRKNVMMNDEENNNGDNNNIAVIDVTYDADLVGKAIHVIRNPLDNIVARYHLMWNRYNDDNDEKEWTTLHPNNVTGFKKWCLELDTSSELPNMRWIDERLKALFQKIPCHQEFFRYVQWHNLAFSLTRDMSLPSMIINYQDYDDDLEGTTNKLLQFLELERKGPNIPFVHGKEYKDYYTKTEKDGIKAFIMEYATDDTWKNVRGYELFS